MSQFMGVGTTLYGEKNYDKSDHSYTATKWLIFFFLQIFPLASYKVKRLNTKFHFDGLLNAVSKYELQQVPLDQKQVLVTYLFGYSVIPVWIWLASTFEDYSTLISGVFCLIPLGFVARSARNRGSFS